MGYQTKTVGNCSIINLAGEIDLQSSPPVREEILSALKNQLHVMIEMSGVQYIDSSGIASLIEGLQYARNHNLKLGLVNISQATRRVLELARLDQVFTLFKSIDEGLAAANE